MNIRTGADGCPLVGGATLTSLVAGTSDDKKYRVDFADGTRCLLRISRRARRGQTGEALAVMRAAEKLGVPAQRPVQCGAAGQWRYSLLTWVEGALLWEVLPQRTEAEQYALGLRAGTLLKQIHTAAPAKKKPAAPECRPSVLRHGDFHAKNLILRADGSLAAIDFVGGCGDPWKDLCAIPVGEEANPFYQTGLMHGYFHGAPPPDFFAALAGYFIEDVRTRLSPADPPDVLDTGCRHIQNILRWFDHFQRAVPTWYLSNERSLS
ncbi:MAG: phosphotransferase [Oscillospiraceae bacterium]|jgi:serine/threonine-protein kinase|nr:phosphotransferase [Oscillospiraceae bacterium]